MTALDLFAGTGWGVACQRLGIPEIGVEIMPEAVASREANGMHTAYLDVWDGLRSGEAMAYDTLIASPPCQTFSMAGGGAGRRALDDVLAVIREGVWRDAERLHELADRFDPRTALVVTPLAHVWRDLPRAVVLEQVPPVLPVWEACAEAMREIGYSVWTGILNAEQYGVPQTRRRAVLIARIDGEAIPPAPTHSRYYSRDPQRLDPGVLPWVSMAQALGWSKGAGPAMRSNYGTGGDPAARGKRMADQPAPTMTSKAGRNAWVYERPAPTIVGTRRSRGGMLVGRQLGDDSRSDVGGHPGSVGLRSGQLPGERVSLAEAAALQSYPPGFVFCGGSGKQYLQVGNAVPPLLAEAILRATR